MLTWTGGNVWRELISRIASTVVAIIRVHTDLRTFSIVIQTLVDPSTETDG